MKKSANPEVQKWLLELEQFDDEKFKTVATARAIVLKTHPKVSERIMYGGIMFTLTKDLGGLFVNKNHISFEFSEGYIFKDPDRLLEGSGKFRRHLKLNNLADVKEKDVSFFVEQIKNNH
jgi:hypothetical protein